MLEPLRFAPLFRPYVWGGRRLEHVLGIRLPDGETIAESWQIVDHGEDQSVVLAGRCRGATLGQLVRERGTDLLGRHAPLPHFPLLFKFLDAHRNLSVQVHPNDRQAARLRPPDRGKTEAWVVLHAEPGSVVYAGLREGVDRDAIEAGVADGTVARCLHAIEPQAGDCLFIPAGTVHALGAGLVVAEIQQSSDTTYRLFDWNRLGHDGKPRPLHVAEALAVIDWSQGPVPVQSASVVEPGVERLVACEQFVLERRTVPAKAVCGGDDRCHLLAVLEGAVRLEGDPLERPLERGQSALLPAAAGRVTLTAGQDAVLLDMYLP